MDSTLFLALVIFLVIAVAGLFLSGIKVIAPHERGCYFRMRRFVRILEPGIWFVSPLVSDIVRVDMRERTPIPTHWNDTVTSDGINVGTVVKVSYRVVNPEKAIFGDPPNTKYGGMWNVYEDKLREVIDESVHKVVRLYESSEAKSHPEKVASAINFDIQGELPRMGLQTTKLSVEFVAADHSPLSLPPIFSAARFDRSRPRKLMAERKNL